MFRISFLFSLLFCCLNTHAQKLAVKVTYAARDGGGSNDILYRPGQDLDWNDFRGKPVAASDAAAITSAGMGIQLSFSRLGNAAELLIAVNCSFSKKDSWVKLANKTSYILNHEQHHFDIAFLNTLIFIQRLKEAKYTVANYTAVIEKIYNKTALEMGVMQDEYDRQTDHSRKPEKQAEWDAKISMQLESVAKQ